MLSALALAIVASAPDPTLWAALRGSSFVFVGRVEATTAQTARFVPEQVLKGKVPPAALERDNQGAGGPNFKAGDRHVLLGGEDQTVGGLPLPSPPRESRGFGPLTSQDLAEVVPLFTEALALQKESKGREPDAWLLKLLATRTLASTAASAWQQLGREPPEAARKTAAQRLLADEFRQTSGFAIAAMLWLAGPVDEERVTQHVVGRLEDRLSASPSIAFFYRPAFDVLRARATAGNTSTSRGTLQRLDALISKFGAKDRPTGE